MSYLEALILGIIQGLTEFLPVSSSGHLEITKALFGKVPEENLTFTVMLHAATALSTVIVFRKDIYGIVKDLFPPGGNTGSIYTLKIIISMLPAAFAGLFFEEQIDALFTGNLRFVGGMLLITGALLYLADRARDTGKEVSYSAALVIGIAQAVAILPGISRSGATISTSVLLGIDRGKAARFSFLMVVPLILAKAGKDLLSGDVNPASGHAGMMATGFIAAFVTGLLACTWMIRLVKRSKLTYFALYCFVIGAIALGYGLFV